MSNYSASAYFVDGPCSAGKTYAAVRLIAKKIKVNNLIGRTNFCLVGPTLLWIKQTEADFQSLGVHPVVITSETNPGGVVPRIVEFLRAKRHQNCVLLITHAAYFALPYFHRRREDWNTIIDEVPQVDTYFNPRLPRSCRVLAHHLCIGEVLDDQVGELLPKDVAAIERFLAQPLDDCDEPIRPVLEAAISPNRSLFVHVPSWERLVDVGCVSKKDDERNRVHFLTMLKPKPLIGTVVMGADVKKSLLWHWLQALGVEWREHRGIIEQLRYQKYPEALGKRLVIKHFMNEGAWSKRMRNGKPREGTEGLQSQFDAEVRKHVGDHPFLLCTNNDYSGDLIRLPGCERLPAAPHGLNCYQHHTRLVFTAALNRQPMHSNMLRVLGLRQDIQRASTAHSVLHQAVMRTALRNPASAATVEIIVPDRFAADALVEAVGSASVTDLAGTYEPRRRRPSRPEENQQNPETEVNQNNSTSDMKFDKNVTTKIDSYKDFIIPNFGGDRFATIPPRGASSSGVSPPPLPMFCLTLHKSEDGLPHSFQDKTVSSVPGLVKMMRKFSERVRTTKKGDYLFQMSTFDKEAPRDCHLFSYAHTRHHMAWSSTLIMAASARPNSSASSGIRLGHGRSTPSSSPTASPHLRPHPTSSGRFSRSIVPPVSSNTGPCSMRLRCGWRRRDIHPRNQGSTSGVGLECSRFSCRAPTPRTLSMRSSAHSAWIAPAISKNMPFDPRTIAVSLARKPRR
jgi:hypothetical protein